MDAIFEDMDDDLYVRYMIGFTECQMKGADRSSTTSEMLNLSFSKYSSAAMGYAERWNKGAEKELGSQNAILEKRGCHSVKWIQKGITDVVFELSQRRKAPTPLSRFRFGKAALDSGRLSPTSPSSVESRPSSSQSLPMVQVQQLPPMKRLGRSYPNLLTCANNGRRKGQRKLLMKSKANSIKCGAQGSDSFCNLLPRIDSGPLTLIHTENSNHDTDNQPTTTVEEINNAATESSDGAGVTPQQNVRDDKVIKVKYKKKNRLYSRYSGSIDPVKYNSGISTSHLSFCQSSYTERTERDRLNNVRRRYASQTKSGPMDFNKLRRQISLTSSKS